MLISFCLVQGCIWTLVWANYALTTTLTLGLLTYKVRPALEYKVSCCEWWCKRGLCKVNNKELDIGILKLIQLHANEKPICYLDFRDVV